MISVSPHRQQIVDRFWPSAYLVAAWGDQRQDKNGQANAASSSAQALQEAWDEIYTTCQTSGPSLYANPAGPTTCGATPHTSAQTTPHPGTATTTARATSPTTSTATLAYTGSNPGLPVAGLIALAAAVLVGLAAKARS
ncbi:MAG: hypothetical protein ACYCO3_03880 [Mycobacteriales bacterium]